MASKVTPRALLHAVVRKLPRQLQSWPACNPSTLILGGPTASFKLTSTRPLHAALI